MSFLIKVDEDLPFQVVLLLQNAGYEAIGVHQQGMSGWKDPLLWEAIQNERRFLVTADKGFGNIRVYPPGTHQGILLLRPAEDGIEPIMDLLKRVLNVLKLNEFAGATIVANPRNIRIRKK